VKPPGSQAAVRHISAPLKGLSSSSKLTPGDPLTAVVLENWTVELNLIRVRPGTVQAWAYSNPAKAVETLVPFYGAPARMAAAIDGKLITLDGTDLGGPGFTGNDWSWTSFANLSSADYTVMVNGSNGVWSWDGTNGGLVHEAVTAPVGDPWIVPDQFNIVLSHLNRLWFADSTNLAVYYLPLQQKTGEVKYLPLNAIFKRGGTIRAMMTWTTDGAVNLNDQLAIFTSNGECAIWQGIDPDTDMSLSGVFRFDAPMSKHSVVNYGGDLYVLISTGLVPMSVLMRAETEQLGNSDKNIVNEFLAAAAYRSRPGWEAFLNPSDGRIYCNTPQGSPNSYRQLVRNMPGGQWASWNSLPARCWGWISDRVYFGSDDGKVYEFSKNFLNDNGNPILADVQMAWGNFGTPAIKQFKMVLPYIQSTGTPRPFVDIKVDYDLSQPNNQPDVTFADIGASWDTATWDVDAWASGINVHTNWQGVARLGSVGGPRLMALVSNAEFSLAGFDVLYETGSIFG
jgi:hypothetical protein